MTASSAGVPDALVPRLEVAVGHLRQRGFEVVLGDCLSSDGPVSAPASARAGELTGMLLDPSIRAVVPPWGGELAIDLLPLLDWDALAAAEPTWLVGYSDVSTLLVALTLRTGMASLHGPNLMEIPYAVPPPLTSWVDVVSAPPGAVVVQGPTRSHRRGGYDDWAQDPDVTATRTDTDGAWSRLGSQAPVSVRGRLIGGCIETVANLAGTPDGELATFAARHAPEGLVIYLEAAESPAYEIGRRLHQLRQAGWFDAATAVLTGRTGAPDSPGYTQRDAVADALGDLAVPILLDVDLGHVPPQLALVNGAVAEIRWSPENASLSQTLA